MTLLLCLSSFVIGLAVKPLLSSFFKKHFGDFFEIKLKRFEIVFKIEFYNQPSIHHLGEEGILVKSDPVKIQIDAPDEEEALNILDGVIKQEIKSELLSIKEIQKI